MNNNDKKIYLTKEGIKELQREYDELIKIKRPDLISRVSQARNMGDLSENAEYSASRDELSFVDGRIDELEEMLKQALVINENTVKKSSKKIVKLGSTVTLNTKGKKESFTLVGEWEADPTVKKISHESPLGKALLEKEIGERIEVDAPAGKILYTIVDIN